MFIDLTGTKDLYGEPGSISFIEGVDDRFTRVWFGDKVVNLLSPVKDVVNHYNNVLAGVPGNVEDMDDDEKMLFDPETQRAMLVAILGEEEAERTVRNLKKVFDPDEGDIGGE